MLWAEFMERAKKMGFPERLAALRKSRGLSQKALAAAIGVHETHLRRYEAGRSQPTLEVLQNLARTLRVSSDVLLFGEGERGPTDDLRVQFEALSVLDNEEMKLVKAFLEAMLLRHESRRWSVVA